MRKLTEVGAEKIEYSVKVQLAEGGAPSRIPIAMVCVRYKGKQRVEITRAMLAQVVANFRAQETDVPLDFDHAIEFAAGEGEPVRCAGWIKSIDDTPDAAGILWGGVEWTAIGAERVAKKEYRYISPVIDPSIRSAKTGEPQGWTLTSAALTNKPVLTGMPALVLSARGWEEIGRGDAADSKESKVKVTKLILADRAARTVRVVLEDGTEQTVIVEGLEALPQQVTVLRLSNVKRDDKGRLDFASLDCGGDALVAGEVFRAHQAQIALEQAMAEGKILPVQREAFEKMAVADLAGFQKLVASMKPQVDMKTRGSAAEKGAEDTSGKGASARVADATQARIVASQNKLGYSEAMRLVLRDDPKLAEEYKAELAGREK